MESAAVAPISYQPTRQKRLALCLSAVTLNLRYLNYLVLLENGGFANQLQVLL